MDSRNNHVFDDDELNTSEISAFDDDMLDMDDIESIDEDSLLLDDDNDNDESNESFDNDDSFGDDSFDDDSFGDLEDDSENQMENASFDNIMDRLDDIESALAGDNDTENEELSDIDADEDIASSLEDFDLDSTDDSEDTDDEDTDASDIGAAADDELDDPSSYMDGAVVDNNELLDDEEDSSDYTRRESDFISDSGNIVVQDAYDDAENGFELKYVDIDKIAITNRIRNLESVEGLVQSIQSTGLLRPVVVAPTATEGLFVLLDGLRRIQACARAGKNRVPCVINNRVSTPEIPILEAMYNQAKKYSIKEQIAYIDYLEKQKGIMNPAMIEYLLQMNSGDYTKLKDILNDNDEDIVQKLYEGVYDIATAFKKLEQRRKKESAEEKENKKAAKVYGNAEESGIDQVEGAGEDADGGELTEEQIKNLNINLSGMDEEVEDADLSTMVEEDKQLDGYEDHKQKVGEREYIDPAIRKATMARDNSTCRCCKRGGEQYVDILDLHHVLPVYLGGVDSVDNSVMLCVACHRLVHLYATGDLNIQEALLKNSYDELNEEQKNRYENEEIFLDEQNRFKRIIYLGSKIRKAAVQKGLNREQFKKEHSNAGIGRRKPGKNAPQEHASSGVI